MQRVGLRVLARAIDDSDSRALLLFSDVSQWVAYKKTLHFNGGGNLKFRFLERPKDAKKYQGHDYTWLEIEEAGNYPTPKLPDMLRATLRSAAGVTCRNLLTANPGDVGHNWIKERYISPASPLTPFESTIKIGTREITNTKIFIPAKLSDNKILVENDPNYKNNIALATVGQEWLLRAWLDGNWDITAGGMFDDIWKREKHVVRPFAIPSSWTIKRAYDWGSSKPFSVGWWAVSDGSSCVVNGKIKNYPPGTFFRIAEWYGWNGEPNQGIRMLEKDIAKGILEFEKSHGWKVEDGPADSSIFDEENGQSIAKEHRPFGIYWKRADKRPGSRIAGWRKIREMLLASLETPMEESGLFIFENCLQFIRTVPILPRDQKKLDDVDTDAEDHIGDETRYMLRYADKTARMSGITGF